jgi:hypothetical protein
MGTTSTSFRGKLRIGRIAEGRIAAWFMSLGYAVLPVYDKEMNTGKGPQVFTADGSFVAPDMLVFKSGKVLWVEAKQKTVFTWHRITERWTTGIDLRHYEDYLRLAKRAPWPLWILFLHLSSDTSEREEPCPTGLFGQELAKLAECENHRHTNWGSSGMVYWAYESLKLLAPLSEVIPEEAQAA